MPPAPSPDRAARLAQAAWAVASEGAEVTELVLQRIRAIITATGTPVATGTFPATAAEQQARLEQLRHGVDGLRDADGRRRLALDRDRHRVAVQDRHDVAA